MLNRLALALALAVASALPASTAVVAQSALPLIRVGAGPDDPSMPLIYAAQSGMYAKAGLNVEVEKLAGAAAIAAALAGGSLEIGKGATMTVATAISKGLPFTIIGNISEYESEHPDIALIVLADSAIHSPKDLIGKTMADVSLTDQNSVSTFAWLDQHGVDSSTMKYVEIPASAALAAMQAGRVAGSTVYEPVWSATMATGKVRVLGYPYDAIARRFSTAVLFANVGWVNAHRDEVSRFLHVTQDAAVYVAAHESEMGPVSAQFGGVDPAMVATMHHAFRTVLIDSSDVQPVIDTAVKYKVIAQPMKADDIICTCALRRGK